MNKDMIRQAQALQAKLTKAQEELGNMKVEGSAGGGAVKVTIDGHQRVHGVNIAPEVVNAAEVDMLQDLVMAAFNDAVKKSQDMAANQLSGLTGGLKIPGLF
ncbi:MAG TPA: YbaB/EbfC family nucleoid-associated protein [Dehalococcoidia bacterium]|nr:YbaB/EbfC family nucleoid-associated protein [Dehalococcoidia bacterium]